MKQKLVFSTTYIEIRLLTSLYFNYFRAQGYCHHTPNEETEIQEVIFYHH